MTGSCSWNGRSQALASGYSVKAGSLLLGNEPLLSNQTDDEWVLQQLREQGFILLQAASVGDDDESRWRYGIWRFRFLSPRVAVHHERGTLLSTLEVATSPFVFVVLLLSPSKVRCILPASKVSIVLDSMFSEHRAHRSIRYTLYRSANIKVVHIILD